MQSSDVDHLDEANENGEPPGGPEAAQVSESQNAQGGRRPIDWKLAFASLPIALGLFLIGWALTRSVTGDDVTKLPDAIEEISPTPDAVQVLAQTNVVVDLAEGYVGELTIDAVWFPTMDLEDFSSANVEPGTQVDIPAGVLFEPGNDTLTFTPGPSIDIDRFGEGLHTVKVVYWRAELGDANARSYTWTFNVV